MRSLISLVMRLAIFQRPVLLIVCTALVACQTLLGIDGDPPTAADAGPEPVAEEAKLRANDPGATDFFGFSLSIDGDTMLVGAQQEDAGGVLDSGSVYVFVRSGSEWVQQAKLTADDGESSDNFGTSVSMSGDTALVGAHRNQNGAGAAYVFVRDGSSWSQQAKLTRELLFANDFFGFSVSLDGDTAVVGAFSLSTAYVFQRSGTTWEQQAVLSSDVADDDFGRSVSIDGDTILVGADSDNDSGPDSGAAYVFERDGTEWPAQAKLTASAPARTDRFGFSVSVDGDTALIGAPFRDDAGDDAGAAFVFVREGTVWSQQARLTAGDAEANDQFARAVSLSGNRALLGAPQDDDAGPNSGSAHVFERTGVSWTPRAKLTASDSGQGDGFGGSVSVDGDTGVVGSPGDDDNFDGAGSAHLFGL